MKWGCLCALPFPQVITHSSAFPLCCVAEQDPLLILDIPTSITLSRINLLLLHITQSQAFCYSKRNRLRYERNKTETENSLRSSEGGGGVFPEEMFLCRSPEKTGRLARKKTLEWVRVLWPVEYNARLCGAKAACGESCTAGRLPSEQWEAVSKSCGNVLVQGPIAVERHRDHNSYKGQCLLGAVLQSQRFISMTGSMVVCKAGLVLRWPLQASV